MDVGGQRRWFMAVLGNCTSYATVVRVKSHHGASLWKANVKGWLSWAGPPDYVTADGETGRGGA
eukprot:9985507-Lingulodinium_polyedra.AAC.1